MDTYLEILFMINSFFSYFETFNILFIGTRCWVINIPHRWSFTVCRYCFRYMFGLAGVFSFVHFLAFVMLPESPRWYIGQRRYQDARHALTIIRRSPDVDKEFNDLLKMTPTGDQKQFSKLWERVYCLSYDCLSSLFFTVSDVMKNCHDKCK